MSEREPTKAYYVRRTALAVQDLLIYANTAEEARELVKWGEGEAFDVGYDLKGLYRARRAPEEDRR